MASNIYSGLVLFALLHLGMTYSIWGPRDEQDATLNAVFEIFKSVDKNLGASDTIEESNLLAFKLLTLFKQVHGMQTRMMDIIGDKTSTHISEAINIIVNWTRDPKLERAEQDVHKSSSLYLNDYLYFLDRRMLPHETRAFIHDALKLDTDSSFETSETMSSFFGILATEVQGRLKNYGNKFPSTHAFLNELLKYHHRNEWNRFMMITTAYKLQSLESNNNNYEKEFKRLEKQLWDKLALHENEFQKSLSKINAK